MHLFERFNSFKVYLTVHEKLSIEQLNYLLERVHIDETIVGLLLGWSWKYVYTCFGGIQ